MCGILAIFFRNEELGKNWKQNSKELLDLMAHRGPDAEKIDQYKNVIFAHRRLSIIDLTDAGIQPMLSEDGRFSIILNGEIYNYLEIKQELEKKGYTFQTETDTEVLLNAYIEYREKIFSKINGMYSFMIWDNKLEELFIARDRFGIKPLFYTKSNDTFLFSSEIKPLLKTQKETKPNEKAIYDFLVYSAVDHNNETFFEEIYRFPAGHYLKIKSNLKNENLVFKKYWDLNEEVKKTRKDVNFKQRDLEEHIKKTKELFINSVKLRLRSDVKVGSCLSGGIDSSSIVSIISNLISEEERKNYETFSMIYGDWFDLSEKKFIDIVTNETRFKPNYTTPNVDKINNAFDRFLLHQEEPVTTLSPIGQYFVMELAKKEGTIVLLDGQGADEILAGYLYLRGYYLFDLFRRFKFLKLLSESWKMRKDKTTIKYFLAQFFPKFLLRAFRKRGLKNYLTEDFSKNVKGMQPPGLANVRKPFHIMLKNLLGFKIPHLLRWEDKSSMAFSIEARVPFLDHNFVKYILSLPSEYIVKNGITKWIFRKSMDGITPNEILSREDKIGFAVPEKNWLIDENLTIINDLKNKIHSRLTDYVKINVIKELLGKRKQNTLDNNDLRFLFCIACLNRWFHLFF